MSINNRVSYFQNSSFILAVLFLLFTAPLFHNIYVRETKWLKEELQVGNENVFHWKYLLSTRNRVPQQNALTSRKLKKDYCLPRLNFGHIFFAVFLQVFFLFNFAHVFLILTRVFSEQKSRLVFFDIIISNTLLWFLLFSLWIEETSRNCSRFCAVFNKKIPYTYFTRNTFFSTQLQCFIGVT